MLNQICTGWDTGHFQVGLVTEMDSRLQLLQADLDYTVDRSREYPSSRCEETCNTPLMADQSLGTHHQL